MNSLQAQFKQAFLDDNRWLSYLNALKVTFLLTLVALAIGIVLGILVAVVRTIHDQNPRSRSNPLFVLLNTICKIYTTVIRGTPMMVQLMIWGFVIFKFSRNFFGIAVLALGINSGAYVAEIVRGGIMSIDPGQMEAGRSLGLGYPQVMRSVIIPQAIKNILPALGNELITLFKDTSLVSVLGGVVELTKNGSLIAGKIYNYTMPMYGVALLYLVVVLILTWLQGILERRLRRSDRI